MENVKLPVATGKTATFSLEGLLLAIGDTPILICPLGTDVPCLPLFSTPAKLKQFLAKMEIQFTKIMRIHDGKELLDNLPKDIQVMYDPHFKEDGTVNYFLLQRDRLSN